MKRQLLFMAMCLLPFSLMAVEYTDEETHLTFEIQTWEYNVKVAVIKASPFVSGDLIIPSHLLGYPVGAIGERAFENNTALTSVSIPSGDPTHGNLTLGLGCFKDCTNLKTVKLGSNIFCEQYIYPGYGPYMGHYAFEGCTAIEELYMDSNVDRIPVDNLKTLVFGDNITEIIPISDGRMDMINLENLTIGKNVKKIAALSFTRAEKLGSFDLPEGLEEIGGSAFEKCVNAVFTLPSTLKEIGYGAFCDCKALTSITIPGGVEYIEGLAFAGCDRLESVKFEEGVLGIGDYAFGECISLKDIRFPKSLLGIGASAFANCKSLQTVTIPKGVEWIAEGAFADNPNLMTVISLIEDPFGIEDNTFNCSYEKGTLYVPNGTEKKYRDTYAWSCFENIKNLSEATEVAPIATETKADMTVYSLDGRRVAADLQSMKAKGVYITGGHKVLVK